MKIRFFATCAPVVVSESHAEGVQSVPCEKRITDFSSGGFRRFFRIPNRHKWAIVVAEAGERLAEPTETRFQALCNWNHSYHESMGGKWGVLVHARGLRGLKNQIARIEVRKQAATCRAAARFQKGE